MKINVVFNKYINNYKDVLESIEAKLVQKSIDYKAFELDSMGNFGDFTLVIGGDGTLLRTARFYSEWKIPVLGINTGRLGSLSQGVDEEIDSILDSIINKTYIRLYILDILFSICFYFVKFYSYILRDDAFS